MVDTASKPTERRVWLRHLLSLLTGLAIGLVAVAFITVPRAGWTSADVTTGRHAGYPDLTARHYDMPLAQTTQVAAQLASGLGGWRVVHLDAQGGEMQAEVKSALLLPAQVVTVAVRPTGPGGRYSEVLIRSRSTVGFADFGINARHIRGLQALMDDKLPLAP